MRGVIAAEMPSTWSARGAQGPGGRGADVRDHDRRRRQRFYDQYPDTRSQMYRGVAAETPATDAAVAATRGQVVTYDGAPSVTYFFSSSGGYTENIENAWPGATARAVAARRPRPLRRRRRRPLSPLGPASSASGRGRRAARASSSRASSSGSASPSTAPRRGSCRRAWSGPAGPRPSPAASSQGTFGLLSTWAAVHDDLGGVLADVRPRGSGGAKGDLAVIAQMKRVFGQLANASQTLHGTIFPAGKGALATVEVRAGKHWRRSGGRPGRVRQPLFGPPGGRGRLSGRVPRPRGAVGRRGLARRGVVATGGCRSGVEAPRLGRRMPGPLLAVDAPVRAVPLVLRAARTRSRAATAVPVNALLGAVNLILRIAADREPAGDRRLLRRRGRRRTGSSCIPAYHADRPPVPDALAWQFPQAPELFAAFGWAGRVLDGPRGRRPARVAGRGRGGCRRPGADHDRRPRHVPVRRRAGQRRVPQAGLSGL